MLQIPSQRRVVATWNVTNIKVDMISQKTRVLYRLFKIPTEGGFFATRNITNIKVDMISQKTRVLYSIDCLKLCNMPNKHYMYEDDRSEQETRATSGRGAPGS